MKDVMNKNKFENIVTPFDSFWTAVKNTKMAITQSFSEVGTWFFWYGSRCIHGPFRISQFFI